MSKGNSGIETPEIIFYAYPGQETWQQENSVKTHA